MSLILIAAIVISCVSFGSSMTMLCTDPIKNHSYIYAACIDLFLASATILWMINSYGN